VTYCDGSKRNVYVLWQQRRQKRVVVGFEIVFVLSPQPQQRQLLEDPTPDRRWLTGVRKR
jgi:hypothetical protein